MPHLCTKAYGHNLGLSACFRQWRATSHCAQLHGYALGFKFTFEATELDHNGWVLDFGSLKPLKQRLESTFDHKLLVAGDDPDQARFHALLAGEGGPVASVLVLPGGVGCEAFARLAWGYAAEVVRDLGQAQRVRVASCECSEHAGNSAVYVSDPAEWTA